MAVKKGKPADKTKKVARIKVTGFAPMSFQDHTIKQKTTGRFEVVNAQGKNVNGDAKVKLLLAAKVLKGSFKKTAEAAPEATAAN